MRVGMTALALALLASGATASEAHKHAEVAVSKTSSGGGSGKASLQDFHFAVRADAVKACDTAPISEADGKFSCSLTPEQARMANNKHPDLMK